MPITTTGSIVYFKDDLGLPLIGGKVYTYEYSTSKPKDIYRTAVRELPHTNPVILNDSGSVEWYLKGDYTIRVYTSEDVFVEEFNIVTPSKVQVDEVSDSLNLLKSELKSAAYRDTGAAAAQVPLNSDLGTAAYTDVGVEPDQIPLNSNLGTAAYKSFNKDVNGFIREEGSTSEVVIKDAAGVATVNGIQAGIDAPKIAYKKLTGTTGANGTTTEIAHGINASKILAVAISIFSSDRYYATGNYRLSVGSFAYHYTDTNIALNLTGTSNELVVRPFTVLITYEV